MKEFPLCLFPGTFGVKGVPVSFYSYSFPKYRRRVSNPRPSVCKTDALPLSYSGIYGGYRIWTCVDGLWDHAGASPVQPANRKRKTRTSPLPPWGSVQTLTLRSRFWTSRELNPADYPACKAGDHPMQSRSPKRSIRVTIPSDFRSDSAVTTPMQSHRPFIINLMIYEHICPLLVSNQLLRYFTPVLLPS